LFQFLLVGVCVISLRFTSTLFPYTTLFRSEVNVYQKLDGYVTQVVAVGAKDPLRGERYHHTESIPQADDKRFDDSAYYTGVTITDRKSTRLNSSHVKISYAVFCLKKKINIH